MLVFIWSSMAMIVLVPASQRDTFNIGLTSSDAEHNFEIQSYFLHNSIIQQSSLCITLLLLAWAKAIQENTARQRGNLLFENL